MTNRDRLTRSQRQVAELAKDALDELWSAYSGLPPAQFQEMLLELVPALVEDYGKIAGVAAAEWYEQTRAAVLGDGFQAVAVTEANLEAVRQSVKWAGGPLFDGAPLISRDRLGEVVDRHVKQAGRSTVVESARRDPARPRFARIPSGTKTCAFCTMLASRGFVYVSAETAGALDRWHGGCDCQQVPDFALTDAERAAYEARIDEMREQYAAARAASDTGSAKQILAAMRSLHASSLTDGTGAGGDKQLARVEALRILREAGRIEPEVTDRFRRIAAQQGATLAGLEFRLKGVESLSRKVEQLAADRGLRPAAVARLISDALRYTMVASPADYARTVQSVIESLQADGWIARVKNYWPDAQSGYNGVNVAFTRPDGQLVELQFHTAESLRAKEGQLHALYERARVATSSRERERLAQEMLRIGRGISARCLT